MAKKKKIVKYGVKARKAIGGTRYDVKRELRHKKAKK